MRLQADPPNILGLLFTDWKSFGFGLQRRLSYLVLLAIYRQKILVTRKLVLDTCLQRRMMA